MKLFSHSSIILPITNVQQTAEYYRDVLGFSIEFLWEDPPSYAVLKRDDAVGIHLSKTDKPLEKERLPRLYIFVHDADAVYNEYVEAGAKIDEPIGDTDYQMREFVIEDLNGYKIVIGKGIQ